MKEQQTAPARAYLEYSVRSPSCIFNGLVIGGSGISRGRRAGAATRDDDRGGETGERLDELQMASERAAR